MLEPCARSPMNPSYATNWVQGAPLPHPAICTGPMLRRPESPPPKLLLRRCCAAAALDRLGSVHFGPGADTQRDCLTGLPRLVRAACSLRLPIAHGLNHRDMMQGSSADGMNYSPVDLTAAGATGGNTAFSTGTSTAQITTVANHPPVCSIAT